MTIDPIVSLISSLQAAPGVFAVLVGSGISQAAGVPTGWDVTVDLLRRLATAETDDEIDDPVAWYATAHGADPDYSAVLDAIAPSPADRRNLLNGYFEPTDDERAQGLKVPTRAHHAIAQMVARGYVRVIVTTNFDRLLEAALADAGVDPVVIATADAAAGAIPLAHSRCTVVKVHGDYLSPELRNTVAELATYTPAIDHLLDQIFDEYGVVICGWSATWDTALRNALMRSPSRRYSTFWATTGDLSPEAETVSAQRDATVITIEDADTFFDRLHGKVLALEALAQPSPLSVEIAVAELKRYLPDPSARIQLRDLLTDEIQNVIARTGADTYPMQGTMNNEQYLERVDGMGAQTAMLCVLTANLAYYAVTPEQDALCVDVVRRLVERRMERGGVVPLLAAQQFPAMLAMYSVGLGALLAERPDPFLRVLRDVSVADYNSERPVSYELSPWRVLDGAIVKRTERYLNRKTPSSDYLYDTFKVLLTSLEPNEDRLEGIFDDVEYLIGILGHASIGGGYFGRFAWRRHYPYDRGAMGGVVDRYGADLRGAGLFESEAQLAGVRTEYEAEVDKRGVWF